MTKKTFNRILNLMCGYIILQPIFDVISNLYIDGYIGIPISLVIKPLFVFSLGIYVFFRYTHNKRFWLLYVFLFLILVCGHSYLLYKIAVDSSTIINEVRCLLNIAYMITVFIIYITLYKNCEDKKDMLIKLKKTIVYTFLLYSVLLLLAVITKTSGKTYEYADPLKEGFKGWYDSGQILGHALSMLFPIILYTVLKPRNKWYMRVLLILPLIICAMLIGTKVPYFMVLITLGIYIIVSLFCKMFISYYRINIFNLCFSLICIIGMAILFRYMPVYHNIQINNQNRKLDLSSYEMEKINGSLNIKIVDKAIDEDKGDYASLKEYRKMCVVSSEYLKTKFENKDVHPSQTRDIQYLYSKKKFSVAPFKYKLFGIGYLNQNDTLSLESDLPMSYFCFGILGFICMTVVLIYYFIKDTIYVLKNMFKIDLETYLLYLCFGIFFSISIFAGYTYIYTNFSLYLIIAIIMLNLKISINKSYKKNDKVKNIAFLLLHLGYGGIESATINTANELSKKYNVELISFYKLDKTQSLEINKKVKLRYLYNGGPNRDSFKEALKNKKIISVFKEGIKAIDILIKKKILVIKTIKSYKGDALISTRSEFSALLSKYGEESYRKLAVEHRHHNNDKKYINCIKHKYYNIDYVLALTEGLKNDFIKFLKNNHHTKVVVVPNMLTKLSDKVSDLGNRNVISVGRLHEGKRIDELIRIFSKVKYKSSKLYIIGDGDEYFNLLKIIDELGLNDRVYLLGYKNHNEIVKYMMDSCIFAMTSITEGLPMVLLEAGSVGIPSIAYETDSGVNDIIDDGINGFVIKNRNEEEYITKLNEYLENKKLQKTMSSNMIKKTKEFSAEKIAKIWINVLEGKY